MDDRWHPVKTAAFYLSTLIVAALGWFSSSCAWHLYNDHLLIDALRQDLQRQQQPQKPQ